MAQKNCAACDDLKNSAPNFVVNGLTNTEIASLKNNTGLNPSNSNNDCTDLNNMNDCLIGNMADEVDAYDVCDWKTFMKQFIPNVWTMFAGVIASICGTWARVNQLCSNMDGVLDAMTGHPALHLGHDLSSKITMIPNPFDPEGLKGICFDSEIYKGVACTSSKRIWAITVSFGGGASYSATNLAIGDKLAYWNKSDLVPTYFPEERWQRVYDNGVSFTPFSINDDTLVQIQVVGNGDGRLVMEVIAMIGSSRTGTIKRVATPVERQVI